MTEAGWTVCIECGMMCEAVEYHPYAACLMFKQCLNSETVRANLQAVRDDSYQQGMAAAFKQGIEKLREREKFYTEQEAISEGQMRLTRGLQRNESSCCIHELEKLAQAAQDEKGVGDVHKLG